MDLFRETQRIGIAYVPLLKIPSSQVSVAGTEWNERREQQLLEVFFFTSFFYLLNK